jgi:hypothetical protein
MQGNSWVWWGKAMVESSGWRFRSWCRREWSQVPGTGDWVVLSMWGRGSLWSDCMSIVVGAQSAHKSGALGEVGGGVDCDWKGVVGVVRMW